MKFILCILFVSVLTSFASANSEDSIKTLILTKQYQLTNKQKVNQNKKIKIWINSNHGEKRLKGRYSVLSDSTIKVKNEIVSINDISKIRASNLKIKKVGLLIMLQGVLGVGLGTTLYYNGKNKGDEGLFTMIIGFIYLELGVLSELVGFSIYEHGVYKKYNLENEEWKLTLEK